MKLLKLILLTICAFPFVGSAQINLVRNPSLEQYARCPNITDGIKYANFWSSISDTIFSATDSLGDGFCTPEYCNTCCISGSISVPNSATYYHYPRTGNGMAQVQMYYTEVDTAEHYKRDYLQGRLKSVLIPGKQYGVSFYVTLEQVSAYAIDHIGAFLDDGTIDTTTNCGHPQTTHIPQVHSTGIINDTLNWVKIEGTFTATGIEKFITIGNFFDLAHTDTLRVHFPLGTLMHNDKLTWYLR